MQNENLQERLFVFQLQKKNEVELKLLKYQNKQKRKKKLVRDESQIKKGKCCNFPIENNCFFFKNDNNNNYLNCTEYVQ